MMHWIEAGGLDRLLGGMVLGAALGWSLPILWRARKKRKLEREMAALVRAIHKQRIKTYRVIEHH
jgi:hypothetical protein